MPDEPGIHSHVDGDAILHVVFDRPGGKVNLLDGEVLEALDRLLDEVPGREVVRGVLFRSAKPGTFIAGLDVEQIAAVRDAHSAADGARAGQRAFQRIADLGRPSVCAINGTCLGGGAELALACTFRVAADDPAVRIGLPEVQIGIIPGYGGTQRLPRLVGLTRSLDLILTGKRLDARQARRVGLVDLVVPAAYLERESLALLRRAAAGGAARVERAVRRRPRTQVWMESIGPLRRYVLGRARKRTEARVDPLHYPAPYRAIEAIEAAFVQPMPKGLDFEARLVGELVPTETTSNLIWLFKSRTALKNASPGVQASPRPVGRIAILGAGVMGGGIARLAADHGLPVRLKDLEYDAILRALGTAAGTWRRELERNRMTQRELRWRMARIAPTLDDTGLATVDLVVEAVVENLEVKREVLAAAEQRLPERAVFATNTSSLPIGEIAARALRPERVVGLHFFNPVHRMPLVEVIAGRRSSPEAVATVRALALRLGKVPVLVKDEPGFLVNRILTLYLNEAMRLLVEGQRIENVDRSMSAFGMPMGPLALLDEVGLDTAEKVGQVLRDAFGQRIQSENTVLRPMVAAERIGRKVGAGFYRYRNDNRSSPDTAVYGLIGSPPLRELPPETLQERMVLSMINEAAVCLEEGVARQPRDVDLAMVLGTGFPPFRGGLLRHADAIGIPIVVDRLARLADAHGTRFRPAESLQAMVRNQQRFYPY